MMSDKPQLENLIIKFDVMTIKVIDEHVTQMRKMIPTFTRSQMINLLIARGLEVYEQEQQPETAGKRG
jgi:hypothetical protein